MRLASVKLSDRSNTSPSKTTVRKADRAKAARLVKRDARALTYAGKDKP
jgi:hypothetical protein